MGEEFWRHLVRSAPLAIVIARRADGRLLQANAAALTLYQYSAEELLGLQLQDLFGPGAPASALPVGAISDSQQRRRDGSLFPAEVCLDEGVLGGEAVVGCLVRDISRRTEAVAEQRRLAAKLRLIIDSTDDGILGADPEGRCTFSNPAAATMLGYGPEELVGHSIHEVIHHRRCDGAAYPIEDCPLFGAMATGLGSRTTEEVLWRKDGSSFPVELSTFPMIDNGVVQGGVMAFQDISQRRRAEEEREHFLHAITHDLRQPLTVIQVQAETLHLLLDREGIGGRIKHSVGAIHTSSRRMAEMLRDLTDAAYLELGELQVNVGPLDLYGCVSELAERLAGIAEPGRIEVEEPGALPLVLAERAGLDRVLGNLIGNALKYSPPGAPIRVRLEQRGAEVVVSVADRGDGIPAEDLPHIFERHFRVRDRQARPEAGLGLGLYIARGLVEAYGGRIWAESEPGRGTTIRFSLLAAAGAATPVSSL